MRNYSYVNPRTPSTPVGRVALKGMTALSEPKPLPPIIQHITQIRPAVQPKKSAYDQYLAERFMAFVGQHLRNLGATPAPQSFPWAPWILETRAGKLYIHVYGDRIMCCFEQPTRAFAVLGPSRLNPNTGRWDFVFGGTPGQDQVNAFKAEIAALRSTTCPGIPASTPPASL